MDLKKHSINVTIVYRWIHFPSIFLNMIPIFWRVQLWFMVVCFPGFSGTIVIHWIGLRENLNRKPMGFYHQILRAFRCKFSHNPIL